MANQKALPNHFTVGFFEKVLEKSVHSDRNVKVLSKHVKMATNPGDNFTSEIYRAKVEYTVDGGDSQQMSLILKNMSQMEFRDEMLDYLQAYEREKEMYLETMPAMSNLLDNEMFCAKCLYATTEPCKLLIFQDLADMQYKLADRKQGLDLAHCKLVLEKIGKFHAASMVLAERQPESMKNYNFGIFRPDQNYEEFERFFIQGFNILVDVAGKWPGYEAITEKLKKIQPNFIDRVYKCVDTKNDIIRVLNHGDLWINNMLFEYSNEEANIPASVMFLDYQASFYTSPGIDLNYFLWCSPSTEVRKNHWSEMIQTYYNALQESLKAMNAPNIPSFEEILAEMAKKQFYAFESCISVMAVILMERQPDSGSSIDIVMGEESGAEFRKIMYNGAKYQEGMKYNLKKFDDMGFLDQIE